MCVISFIPMVLMSHLGSVGRIVVEKLENIGEVDDRLMNCALNS